MPASNCNNNVQTVTSQWREHLRNLDPGAHILSSKLML